MPSENKPVGVLNKKGKEIIRLALIGCGHWGKNYVRVIQQHPQCELVCVCDADSSTYSDLEQLHTGTSFIQGKAESIFADETVDAVVIATPVSTHFELCQKALQNKKHVLCEKPLAIEASKAKTLGSLAIENERLLLPGHIYLYNDAVVATKEYIQNQTLGKLLYITCQRSGPGPVRTDVNVVSDLATHDIAILLYLLDKMPISVQATGVNYSGNSLADAATINLKFEDNIFASIFVSWVHPKKTREICVVGDAKMLLFNDVHILEKVKIYDKELNYLKVTGDYGQFQLTQAAGAVFAPKLNYVEPLITEFNDFVSSISNNTTPKITPRDAEMVAAIIEAVNLSLAQNGTRVSINL
jgi:predicted dehydrogenase